jgi:membrane protease YdiL (CAAX protease family)
MIPPSADDLTPGETLDLRRLPWSEGETWLGVGLMIGLTLVSLVTAAFWRESLAFQTLGVMGVELMYLLPVLAVLVLRKAPTSAFGLTRFQPATLGIGCGLMFGGYFIIAAHNLILMALNLQPQAAEITQIMSQLKTPVGFVVAGVFVAPLTEELFFRGFLFGGLEQRYGWKKALLVSSLIFSLFHLNLASLVPTFILGAIFAYLYHQSKSIWPGMILHFLTNAVGIGTVLLLTQIPHP